MMTRAKLLILMFVAIGALVGLSLSYLTYYAMDETSDQNFCVVCHEMDPMVIAYRDDVHGGKGRLGARAKCVDCHLPHDYLIKYMFTKARNGLVEGAIHFFGDPDSIDWQKNLKHRQNYVFDNGCLECHTNILDTSLANPPKMAQKMHKHYQSLLGTSKEIKCASCHFDAGHKGLRSVLNYYKPEHSIYEDAMKEKKLELQKNYKKYGIKSVEE